MNGVRKQAVKAIEVVAFFRKIGLFLGTLSILLMSGCSHIQIDGVPANDLFFQACNPQTVFSISNQGNNNFIFDDLNGNGVDEVINILNDPQKKIHSMLILYSLEPHFSELGGFNDYTQFSYVGKIRFEKESQTWMVLTSHRKNGDMNIFLIPFDLRDKSRQIMVANSNTLLKGHGGRVSFGKCLLIPGDGTHSPYVLVSLITAFNNIPRHIVLVNLREEKIQFDFKLGPLPFGFCVADFNGDGKREILMSTWAPSNGAVANGLADFNSYLLMLSFQGNLLYKKKMGEYNSFVNISPKVLPSSNGEPSVILVRSHLSTHQSGVDFIGRWSWKEREHYPKLEFPEGIFSNFSPSYISNPVTGKLNVLIKRSSGELVLVDQDLKILATRKIDFSKNPDALGFRFASNLCKDDAPELVLSDKNHFFILTNTLKLLYQTRSPEVVGPIHWGGAHTGLAYFLPNGTWQFAKIRCHWLPAWVRVSLPIFLILLVLFTPVYMSVRRANKRKSALIQSQAFRAWVLESMDSGVVIFNAAGRLQTINRKAREILKMPEEAPSSINGFEKSLGKTQLGKIMELVRALDRENRDVLQDELDIEIGEEKRRILVTAERVRDNQGHILGRAVSLKDVTDLVRSRDVLAWANLARRLTHEVKTPLASMLLAAERLESTFKSKETPEPEKVKEYLSYLFREIERLRTLSEAMLQLTDIEKKEQTKIDLNRIVREAVDQSSPLLREEVDIEVEVAPEPIFLLGNFRQVLLVVTNILRNAIQSIEKQGKIRIATSVAQGLQGVSETGASSFAVLEVNDTGAGIPESAHANIFDPYFSLRKDGTGLGLAIVKKIVEDMNGKIEFHSEEGLGTTFWLYFPLYSEEKNKA